MIEREKFSEIFSDAIEKSDLANKMKEIGIVWRNVKNMPNSVKNKLEVFEQIRDYLLKQYYVELEYRIYDSLKENEVSEEDRDELKAALNNADACWIDSYGVGHVHFDNIGDKIILNTIWDKIHKGNAGSDEE